MLKSRSAKATLQKSPIFEESRMSKQDFSTAVNQLSGRLNYHKDHQSAKERFMRALKQLKSRS